MFFDSGTTVLCLAKLLPNDNFFVLTSGPSTALEIVRNTVSTVILTGGRLNSDNLSLSGAGAIETARSINVDTAFMAASGYSVGSAKWNILKFIIEDISPIKDGYHMFLIHKLQVLLVKESF